MVLPALAWALASSSFLYIAVPRMPLYQVSALRIVGVGMSITSLFSGINLSATMSAGLQVHNANFVGADVHGVLMDMYYEDWHGELRHIGDLRDGASATCDEDELVYDETIHETKDAKFASAAVKYASEAAECPASPSVSPIFSVNARRTSMSDEDLVSMFLRNLTPGTYIQMMKDALTARGSIEILTSGVLHVKQPKVSLPMSVGIVCSNTFDLTSLPWLVIGHDCIIEDVLPGWSSIDEHGTKLREKTMRKHRETGRVLNRRIDGDEEANGMDMDGPEVRWHDF